MKKPLLITGSHRSGTTWVGQMLALSQSIAYINEPFSPETYNKFRGLCQAKFIHWNTYVTLNNEAYFFPYLKKTISLNYGFFDQLQVNFTLANFKNAILMQYLWLKYKLEQRTPVLKDPLALFSAEWLAESFNMNVLIMIRHPAAFVSSVLNMGWRYNFSALLAQPLLIQDYLHPFEKEISEYSNQDYHILDEACLIWKIMYFVVAQYQKKCPLWIFRRYEDAAKNPITFYKDLYNFLDLSFTDEIEQSIKDYTSSINPVNSPNKDWRFKKRNSRDNILAWKKKLSSEEVLKIRKQVEGVSELFYFDLDW